MLDEEIKTLNKKKQQNKNMDNWLCCGWSSVVCVQDRGQ